MFNLLLPRRRDVVPRAVYSKSFSSSTAPGDVVSGSSLLAGAGLGWCIHAVWFQATVCIFVFPGNQRLWAPDTWEISIVLSRRVLSRQVLSRRSTASWARKPFLINAAIAGHSMPSSSTIWYVAWWSLKQSHMVLRPHRLGMGQPKWIILHEAQWSQEPHGTRVPSLLLIPVSAGSMPSRFLAHYRTQDGFAEWMNEWIVEHILFSLQWSIEGRCKETCGVLMI